MFIETKDCIFHAPSRAPCGSLVPSTLIACGGHHGILIAHHVIHRSSPHLKFGVNAEDTLALVFREEHLRLPMRNLYEIPIGVPEDESPVQT